LEKRETTLCDIIFLPGSERIKILKSQWHIRSSPRGALLLLDRSLDDLLDPVTLREDAMNFSPCLGDV